MQRYRIGSTRNSPFYRLTNLDVEFQTNSQSKKWSQVTGDTVF